MKNDLISINPLIKIRNWVDGILKFPNLNIGDIGIQIGFDLSSKHLTSDLWIMAQRVGKSGSIIGIDPDQNNHNSMSPILMQANVPNKLIHKATYKEKKMGQLIFAKRASWNTISPVADKLNKTGKKIDVEFDTVDNIVKDLHLDITRVKHINITNNGAEYDTLIGMENILSKSNDLALTVVAGRSGDIGLIKGASDFKKISDHLIQKGFQVKFFRMSQLLWWGGVHQLIIKRNWVFGKKPYGIVMANKGKNKRKWYQSYS